LIEIIEEIVVEEVEEAAEGEVAVLIILMKILVLKDVLIVEKKDIDLLIVQNLKQTIDLGLVINVDKKGILLITALMEEIMIHLKSRKIRFLITIQEILDKEVVLTVERKVIEQMNVRSLEKTGLEEIIEEVDLIIVIMVIIIVIEVGIRILI